MLVCQNIMLEGGGEDSGQIIAGLFRGLFQAFDIVVFIMDDMCTVFRHCAIGEGRAPGCCAMIGACGDEDFLAAAIGACGHQRHCGGIRTVLAEHGPVGMGDEFGPFLGQFHHQRGRPGGDVYPG